MKRPLLFFGDFAELNSIIHLASSKKFFGYFQFVPLRESFHWSKVLVLPTESPDWEVTQAVAAAGYVE